MSTETTNPIIAKLIADVAALKKTKQDIVTAGGNSMILARGVVDGELSSLYRKDVINRNKADVTNIPSEPAVVGFVEDSMHANTTYTKKLVQQATTTLTKLIDDERLRAETVET